MTRDRDELPSDPTLAPLDTLARALRERSLSAAELTEAALARHARLGERLRAYKHVDAEGARHAARQADAALARGEGDRVGSGFLGIPVSVKDIYGVTGMPTFAGSARRLPDWPWAEDGWLVERMRNGGAVFVGKTHTVEFAFGGVGFNPHWGTPYNPWDATTARIPGGSSCGAGVSLWEGSAMIALGTDTGGSIRIPAALTGVVGHKTTRGRWPTDGVVPLSTTFDTLGALTRTVSDSVHFFGSLDPRWGDPSAFRASLEGQRLAGLRIAIPECTIWEACQSDVAAVLHRALDELTAAGARTRRIVGMLLDDAVELYMSGGIGKAECSAFLHEELPDRVELLHPTVGRRIEGAYPLDSEAYRSAVAKQRHMAAFADTLFDEVDVLVLPGNLISPPPVRDVENLDRYVDVNVATLRPTCPVNLLEACAVSIPVGLDATGMPVGLQVVARGGDDEALLGYALAIERVLGTAAERLGAPPALSGGADRAQPIGRA